jgi:hypothetical protein
MWKRAGIEPVGGINDTPTGAGVCDAGVTTPTALTEAGSAGPIAVRAEETEWYPGTHEIEPCGLENAANEAALAAVVMLRAGTVRDVPGGRARPHSLRGGRSKYSQRD